MEKRATRKKANGVSTGILLIGLGILAFIGSWWPGLLLVLGISLGFRQYLLGRYYDMAVSLFVFIALYFSFLFHLKLKDGYLVPIILVLTGLFLIFREFILPTPETEIGEEEELELEIEEQDEEN